MLKRSAMFLERYALQNNPFAPGQARPRLQSAADREIAIKLKRAAAGRLQYLLISGRKGVGKTTAVRQGLHYFKQGWMTSWIDSPVSSRGDFLLRLLTDLGLGADAAENDELRKILEMFLQHQAASHRPGLLVVDGIDSLPAGVLNDLQWLAGLRLKGLPLICMILIARSNQLANKLLPGASDFIGDLYQHHVVSGFSIEETRDYILGCLNAAGCNDPIQLLPQAAVTRIQGFTGGIPGHIDALCAVALNALAERSSNVGRRRGLSKAVIDNAAAMLRLEYDESALLHREEPLSREHIKERDQDGLHIDSARLVVASGGQVVGEVSLHRSRIVLGRDDNCDISLNSRFVSRYQNLFLQTADGWLMIDLHSTNGSYVNGHRVREHMLEDGDVIAVGNHQLRFLGGNDTMDVLEPERALTRTRVLPTIRPESPPEQPAGS